MLYSSCFIIAMTGGVSVANHLDKVGYFSRLDVLAIGNENTSTPSDETPTAIASEKGAESPEAMKKKADISSSSAAAKSSPASHPVTTSPPADVTTIQVNEQFSGAALNTNLWTVINRPVGYRNNEQQAYTSSQVEVRDGHLVITAQRDQSGVWTSGEVNSKWAYRYGDFEVRTRLSANGAGVWPAAWLFNSAGVWPGGGEIDIYESINGELSAYGTIHGNGTAGHWQQQVGVHNFDPRNYHIYKISKQPGVVSWWVDGVKRAEWRKESLSDGQSWPFEDFTYIGLLNLAIGGNWPGPSNESTPSKIEYYIDYFTVQNAR
jgi:beta-glucanase (GH16 family)